MKARSLTGTRIATAVGAALLYAAAASIVSPSFVQLTAVTLAHAQEEGHGGGGGDEGGGGGKGKGGGGEEGGGGGKGKGGGGEEGGGMGKAGPKGPRYHGARAGHEGHESGVHGGQGRGGRSAEQEAIDSAAGSTSHHFGGGSELGGLSEVPEGPGQNGYSYGPGPQYQLRYWGGWAIPDGEGETPTEPGTSSTVTTSTTQPSIGSGGGAGMGLNLSGPMRCEGVSPTMSESQRISGANLKRIYGVQAMIGGEGGNPDTVAPFLIANFQEELQRPQPNATLAGTYLGLAAKKPVTPAIVQQVGESLCVSVSPTAAQAIAAAAEDQRLNGRQTALPAKR